ncbi:transglycosylase domain-containing protein [Fluviicola taffensis]|nr:transglycosylase domain-containing protein [Fluviicola taffensis]
MAQKSKGQTESFSPKQHKRATIFYWLCATFPLYFVGALLLFQSEDNLPPVAMLDNPPELLASVIIADDGETELGRYWKINRTSVEYRKISPNVTDALIATEDERFHEHSGVDFRAVGRAIINVGGAGGASTITQQLAKQLYTLQLRERQELARLNSENVEEAPGRIGRMWGRLNEKVRENIIATRLEARFTKEEIITMYLNQFDFLYNAVGISNASKVYFNKKPIQLKKEEAAMLVGMCKNPALYNPYTFKIKNYRLSLARNKEVSPESITEAEIADARASDSLRALTRRNQVLKQWLKNSDEGNEALRQKLTQEEYDILSKKPLITNYQIVDHKRGIAPYFRESLRNEVTNLLSSKNPDGSLMYKREDGLPYDIYRDGLRIYTTLNADMQAHAEYAMERHLKETLQPQFDKNNKSAKNWPFSNSLSDDEVKSILNSSMRRSDRYRNLSSSGLSDDEIKLVFNEPVQMRVFSWDGEKDTLMSPMDSMRYYKSFLQAGLISIEPSTGFVKAWVGGANIDHFAYDHVRLGKRQVGSTIKPFVYAAGVTMNVIKPGLVIPNISYCVDLYDPSGNPDGQWCPRNSDGSKAGGTISIQKGLSMSNNRVAVYVMKQMGALAGPKTVAKLMRDMDIELRDLDVVPAMCLGSMDLSLYELVGAQSTFVNKGIFNKPTSILRIEDRSGHVIYSAKSITKEAMNENVAYTILKMMKGVVQGGTASRLRGGSDYGNIPYPTAAKTGTTQNNSDGWFVGLTPDLATGVWVGAEDRGVRFRSTDQGQGARTALPIYGYYMNKIYKDPKIAISTTDFEAPKNFDNSVFNLTGEIIEIQESDSLGIIPPEISF